HVGSVAGMGFATGGWLEDQRSLAVGDVVFGEIVINDQGIHAVFHEPFADGGAGVGGEVLVGRIVGGGGGDDAGELERAGGLEGGDGANDVGVFLTDGDVDGVNRAELRITAGETDAVDVRLVDDGVDRDGGLAGAAVADDELALATADRNHGIDGHDAGEEGLRNR